MIASTALRNPAARRAVVGAGGRRSASAATATAPPREHMAKDKWSELVASRPPPGHPHTVFEPPFSTPVVAGGVIGVLCTGYGLMYFGMRHQQYKQGYWK
mmetsp:Transcript_34022/g.72515  ORF Transcript_34022/g.72515 Transcript_34022/m.72515 type:complete len:100 (-) Transcript_34022:291-590(-)